MGGGAAGLRNTGEGAGSLLVEQGRGERFFRLGEMEDVVGVDADFALREQVVPANETLSFLEPVA